MQWYYVENNERRGPVEQKEIESFISTGKLGKEDYVWTKGFENWVKLGDVEEFQTEPSSSSSDIPAPIEDESPFYFSSLDSKQKKIYVRTGTDRGGISTDYGPFSLEMMKKLYEENRINSKTLIYVNGMAQWTYLGEVNDFSEHFEGVPPQIDQEERRAARRKPFVARLLLSDNSSVYEGICRDISIGGMQILMADFPGNVGDVISLNVHPQNTQHHFVASGKIVRILEGKQGFSFRFIDLSKEAKKAIESYLNEENG